ncbi:MAG: hypothetical protein IPP16_17515 [Acidimicrobiaceae bacterium]|nr:hypothetical protein [Acidimicrobiaceae bacterium]
MLVLVVSARMGSRDWRVGASWCPGDMIGAPLLDCAAQCECLGLADDMG